LAPVFLAIGRCAAPFARAGGEADAAAADTARRSYRRSPSSHIATAAAARRGPGQSGR